MSLPPPLALVTGGTRRIGAAIAARLAREGHALALHVREDPQVDPALAAVLAETGAEWAVFAADLADEAAVAGLLPAVTARFGRAPTVLVNCASLFTDDDRTSATMARYLDHYRVNVAAPAVLAQGVATAAEAAGALAVVVNILDQRIAHPHGDQLSYSASKMALAELVRLQAVALAPHARVLGVAPGLTLETPDYDPAQLARLADAMPLRRHSRPEDIADAVAWCVRAGASTGQILFVDGGASLKSWDRDFVHLGRS